MNYQQNNISINQNICIWKLCDSGANLTVIDVFSYLASLEITFLGI